MSIVNVLPPSPTKNFMRSRSSVRTFSSQRRLLFSHEVWLSTSLMVPILATTCGIVALESSRSASPHTLATDLLALYSLFTNSSSIASTSTSNFLAFSSCVLCGNSGTISSFKVCTSPAVKHTHASSLLKWQTAAQRFRTEIWASDSIATCAFKPAFKSS